MSSKKISIINILKSVYKNRIFFMFIIVISFFSSIIFWNFFLPKSLKTIIITNKLIQPELTYLEDLMKSNYESQKVSTNYLHKHYESLSAYEIISDNSIRQYIEQNNLPKNSIKILFKNGRHELIHPLNTDGLFIADQYFKLIKEKVFNDLKKRLVFLHNQKLDLSQSAENFGLINDNLKNTEIQVSVGLTKLKFEKSLIYISSLKENFNYIYDILEYNQKNYITLINFVLRVCLLTLLISILSLILWKFYKPIIRK